MAALRGVLSALISIVPSGSSVVRVVPSPDLAVRGAMIRASGVSGNFQEVYSYLVQLSNACASGNVSLSELRDGGRVFFICGIQEDDRELVYSVCESDASLVIHVRNVWNRFVYRQEAQVRVQSDEDVFQGNRYLLENIYF